MKTLHEKIENAKKLTNQIVSENPEVTDVWFQFMDIDLDELRNEAALYRINLHFNESNNRMVLQLGCNIPHATIFCYSNKIKVEQHYVIDTAIKNV